MKKKQESSLKNSPSTTHAIEVRVSTRSGLTAQGGERSHERGRHLILDAGGCFLPVSPAFSCDSCRYPVLRHQPPQVVGEVDQPYAHRRPRQSRAVQKPTAPEPVLCDMGRP